MKILFAFDDTSDLDLVPLAARRALDLAGAKLSLEGWRSLPHADRHALARLGADETPSLPEVHAVLTSAKPAPVPVDVRPDPDPARPPADLVEALGPARGLDATRWAAFSPLERYVLAKVGAKGRADRLNAAWIELVEPS